MAQQIDLSGDGGVLKQILAEGAGPQVGGIVRHEARSGRVSADCVDVQTREIRECAHSLRRVAHAGLQVEPGQTVFAHYTGKLQSGEVFDSTSGKPHRQKHGFYFTPGAGEVIAGWDVVRISPWATSCPHARNMARAMLRLDTNVDAGSALLTCRSMLRQGFASMKVGEKAVLTLRSDYAYGEQSGHPLIPPNATLVFEVELIGARVLSAAERDAIDREVASLR